MQKGDAVQLTTDCSGICPISDGKQGQMLMQR